MGANSKTKRKGFTCNEHCQGSVLNINLVSFGGLHMFFSEITREEKENKLLDWKASNDNQDVIKGIKTEIQITREYDQYEHYLRSLDEESLNYEYAEVIGED